MKLPREVLADLRNRAGLNGSEVAKACGYQSPSGYWRYEQPQQGDKLIPSRVIKKLIPLFVGRGTPPVTHDELIAISEARVFQPEMRHSAPIKLIASFENSAPSVSRSLPVAYRCERGTFVEELADPNKSYGDSGITASVEYPPESQFCAAVTDGHAVGLGYPPGTQLHMVFPDMIAKQAVVGRKALLWVARAGATGLGEMVVAKVTDASKPQWSGEDGQGSPVTGRPVGVVVYSLRRE